MNEDLKLIHEWSKQWLVKFNPNKTEMMFFSLANINNVQLPSIIFDDQHIKHVTDHKHLGITFSHDGSWHKHISNIISSASKVLGSMRFLKFKIKRESLNQIYVSYFRPILEYASLIWDNCTQYEKDSLDKIQYEAARLVTCLTISVQNIIN